MGREDAEQPWEVPDRLPDDILPSQPPSDKWRKRGNGLVIRAPLDPVDIDVLADTPNLRVLYFEREPPARTWELLNDGFFPRRPEICLTVCNWGPRRDDFASLDFLDLLPSVRDLDIDGVRVKDAGALARHPALTELGLGGQFSQRITLDFLPAHPHLRSLGIGGLGFVPRGYERIATLADLETR